MEVAKRAGRHLEREPDCVKDILESRTIAAMPVVAIRCENSDSPNVGPYILSNTAELILQYAKRRTPTSNSQTDNRDRTKP